MDLFSMQTNRHFKSFTILVLLFSCSGFPSAGFANEHLKVSMVASAELRIRGERLVGDDHQWSRFEKEVAIPKDCNRSGIHAKFENSVLTITMPKMHKDSPVVPQPSPKQENKAKTTTATTTPKQALISDQKRKANQKEVQSKKQKCNDFPKQENGRKSLAEHFSSGQEASKPPPPTKTPPEGSTKTPESVITPPGGHATAEEGSDHKGAAERSTKTPESVINSGVKEETREKDGGPDLTDMKATKIEKGTLTSSGIMNGFKFDKYMQAVKDVFTKRTKLNEERQLMVNVGTAVMVTKCLYGT